MANTITGQEILFKMAADCGEVTSEFITAVTSQTVLICRGLGRDLHNTYKYALARVLGKGIRQITAWDEATQTLTLESSFSPDVETGEVIQVAWWNAAARNIAVHAINEAIRAAYPYWYREVIVNQGASTLTLATNDYEYDLPVAIDALLAIGIQPTANDNIQWIVARDGERENYRVEGQAGAYVLRLLPRYSREGAIADVYDGKKICLHYATREPELTAEDGTTQLPLDYFKLATSVYLRNKLNVPEALSANVALSKEEAAEAIAKLGIGKRPPSLLVYNQQQDEAEETKE
jgi:hypothetical protein